MATALAAIAVRGGEAPYDARVGFAGAALLLAALAMAGGPLVATRPRLATGLLLAGSTAGGLAMAFFTIDTWYFVAPPLCRLASALALVRPGPAAGTARGGD